MSNPKPWAILLCKYRDDPNDPSLTSIADLYQQWGANAVNWVLPQSALDSRTILEVYEAFFTPAGAGTYNAVRYWDEMSHGTIDTSGSQVYPCTLNRTIAEGEARAQNPGGAAYQNETFRLAKEALDNQHGVDWRNFFAVAVSFQSPDYGAQGGSYDGGPGVFMDLRYVLANGLQAWGQEMGHAFGLEHSMTDGEVDNNGVGVHYTDPWDVMSTLNAYSTGDGNFGMAGPGLNASNMRDRAWLDENRIWKGSATNDFSELVQLRPLHHRGLTGYLGAELPAIGSLSPYLVEFRVRTGWDAGIPAPVVIVHRFEDSHSYIMKGINGRKGLAAGDVFETGTGPFSRMRVVSIDEANLMATVQLCYSSVPKVAPTVKIATLPSQDPCHLGSVEGEIYKAFFTLNNVPCAASYQIQWSVSGATPVPGEVLNRSSFSIVLPDPSIPIVLSLSITFDDGTTITDSKQFNTITRAQANWWSFLCHLTHVRMLPRPWWEWDYRQVSQVTRDYSRRELEQVVQRTEGLLVTLRRVIALLR